MENPGASRQEQAFGTKLVHVFPYYQTLGGVEAVLRLHHKYDPQFGIDSRFFIYSELQDTDDARLYYHLIHKNDSISRIRKAIEPAVSGPERIVVYHMHWAIPFFSGADRATRRILVLHGSLPNLGRTIGKIAAYLDAIFCVNSKLKDEIQVALPDFNPSRLSVLDCPIDPPKGFINRPMSDPVRIGYCGRLLKEPKGVQRIAPFLRELKTLGLKFEFEILGDGPDREFLISQLSPFGCKFHGTQIGTTYWDILRSWDFIVYFSDSEGTPISLLEGMSQGVIPIYPRLGSGGDTYVIQLSSSLIYKRGDVEEAAQALADVTHLSRNAHQDLKNRCRMIVQSHSVVNYFPHFRKSVLEVNNRPRISSINPPWLYRLLSPLSLTTTDSLSALRNLFRVNR